MAVKRPAFHHLLPAQDKSMTQQSRLIIAQSAEILQQNPVPDTFLGRKTQEPFIQEEMPDDRSGSQ